MPIHDWAKAPTGLYHHFHQQWAGELCNALNDGVLPKGYFALIDIRTARAIPDVLTLSRSSVETDPMSPGGGLAVASPPPKARVISQETDAEIYAARANRVAVRNADGELVAVVEIVSPGNKHNSRAIKEFIKKTTRFLNQGVNLLVVDLFPPSKRDPQGIHKVIWGQIREEPFELPIGKPFTIAAYAADPPRTAYVENVGVGDELPSQPIFLDSTTYIPAPLEASYMTTWQRCPPEFRESVERRSGMPG